MRTWLGGAVMLAIVLSACAAPQQSTPEPTTASQRNFDVDLAKLKRQAKIADCPPPASSPTPATNDGLPDVTLDCLGGGREVRLPDLATTLKRPFVLNIWAQWCPPCRKEAPHFQELYERADAKVAVLGIDHADPRPDLALSLAQLLGLRYPQLADPDNRLRGPFGLGVGLPATVFVGADGTVRHIAHVSYKSKDALFADVVTYLGVRL